MDLLNLDVQPTSSRFSQSLCSVSGVPALAGGGDRNEGGVWDGGPLPFSSAALCFQPFLFLLPQAVGLSSESALSTEGMLLTSMWLSKTILSELVPLSLFLLTDTHQEQCRRGNCELLSPFKGQKWCEEVATPISLCNLCAGSSFSLKYFPASSQTGLPCPKLAKFPNSFSFLHISPGKRLFLRGWDVAPAPGGQWGFGAGWDVLLVGRSVWQTLGSHPPALKSCCQG